MVYKKDKLSYTRVNFIKYYIIDIFIKQNDFLFNY